MADRTCLVTGGTSDVGRATALVLAERGYRVIVTSRTHSGGRQAVGDSAESTGSGSIESAVVDLTDPHSVQELAGEIAARCPGTVLRQGTSAVSPPQPTTLDTFT